VQDGRALDTNYRIGGGRVNSLVSGRPQFSSQMYITGQVTGLGGFRGNTGYVAANQLRLTVPWAALSDFHRQSVGVSDVLGGNTYRTGMYLDRATTALGARGIAAGLTAPGTNVPRSSYVRALVPQKMLDNAMSDFRPLLGKPVGRAISSDLRPLVPIGGMQTPQVANRWNVSAAAAGPPVFGAAELALFTVSRPARRSEVDKELFELDHPSRIDTEVVGPRTVVAAGGDGNRTSSGLGGVGQSKAASSSDAFLAMVRLLQQQHLDGSGQLAPSVRPDPSESKTDIEIKPLGARPGSSELVEQGKRGELIFKTLAGKSKDAYNTTMREAEKLLKDEQFYNAANRYRLAVEIAPDNPMARLGLTVALFAAGEPLSAAVQLRRVMEIFPPAMVTTLQIVRKKIPSETLRIRLDRVYKRLEGRKGTNVNAQLAMVATYMYRSAGENGLAERCAKKLMDTAGDDKLYLAYATFVLTGKRPVSMGPTTRPRPVRGE